MAGPDTSLLTQPSRAILQAAKKGDMRWGTDLFEINEAFAAVGLARPTTWASTRKGQRERRRHRAGHPVGMSGTRVALTALLELRRRGAGLAVVALCGGGGQGDAAILRSLG